MIYDITKITFEKEKKKVETELRDFFIHKTRQEKAWSITNAVASNLKQKKFSHAEAQKITEFLAAKFGIRLPAIAHTQMFRLTPPPRKNNCKKVTLRLAQKKNEFFHQLFLQLQAAVQDNLLDYHQARSLVCETVTHYPKIKKHLPR